jgi:hypothetical protein
MLAMVASSSLYALLAPIILRHHVAIRNARGTLYVDTLKNNRMGSPKRRGISRCPEFTRLEGQCGHLLDG